MVTKLPGRASHTEKEKNLTHSPSWIGRASWGPGVVREASERGRTPRHNSYSSGMFCGVLAPEDALWAAPAPWSRGHRQEASGSLYHRGRSLWPHRPLLSPPLPSLSPRRELTSSEPDTMQAPNERPLMFGFCPSPLMFLPLQACGGARVSRMPPGAKKRMSWKGEWARAAGTHRAPGEGVGPGPVTWRAGRLAHGRGLLLPQTPALTSKRTCWVLPQRPASPWATRTISRRNSPSGLRQKVREAPS